MMPLWSFSPRRFFKLLTLALIAAYGFTIGGMSLIYTLALTWPACHTAPNTPPKDFREIKLTTPDGLTLTGWWKPPQNNAAVLLFPGLGGGKASMLREAQFLAEQGYGVATIDYRACIGRTPTLGYREVNEFNALLDFVLKQPEVSWVGALGFSVGGTSVILGSAERPEVSAVVAIGNYANLYDEMTAETAARFSPKWQVQRLVAAFFTLRTGISPLQISPLEALPKLSSRPVLLIHGEREIERTRGKAQQAAAGDHAILWVVPGADHGEYWLVMPEEYARRVIQFFDTARQKSRY